MDPGDATLAALAARHAPSATRALWIAGPERATIGGRAAAHAPAERAIETLAAHASEPFDAILAARPTTHSPLLPFLEALHRALAPRGLAFVCDLVWQTAPTPELMRAFAPAPGRDRARPIEGYEMQAEHAGFELVERADVDRAAWTAALPAAQRAAVEADTRGAARYAAWALRRA